MDPSYESLIDMTMPGGGIPRRGAGRATVEVLATRELTHADLGALTSGAIGATTPSLTKLRSPHHNMARLLASGVKAVEVSAITGYSQSRISILQGDPAFQELVAYYRTQAAQVYVDVHVRLAELGTVGIEVLQERLDEQPESFGNRELMSLVELTMDRTVAPAKGGKNGPGSGGQGAPAAPAIVVNFVDNRQGTSGAEPAPGITVDAVGAAGESPTLTISAPASTEHPHHPAPAGLHPVLSPRLLG